MNEPQHIQPLIIIGASDQARVLIDLIDAAGTYTIHGVLDARYPATTSVMGYPVLGTEAALPQLLATHPNLQGVVAIGDNWIRGKVQEKLLAWVPEFPFATLIHPTATIASHTEIGPGTVILAGAIIGVGSKIGQGCLINTTASLDHDGVMGDFSSLAPGVTTGGTVCIGAYSAISLGANLIHQVKIGAHAVVGAGATVVRDIPDQVVAFGTPAKVVRDRAIGEKYL